MMGSMAFCISGGKQYRQQRAAFLTGLCICRQHCAVNRINVGKIIRCLRLHQFAVRQAEKRIAELSAIFKRLYEDSVTGRISDERFTELSADYEAEQKELKERAAVLQGELSRIGVLSDV